MTGDSPLYRALSAATTLAWLAVLWLAASLPLVTAPAATVALFRVAGSWGDGVTARGFLAAFRAEVARNSLAGGAWALAGAVIVTDFWAFARAPEPARVVLLGLLLAAAVAYAAATPMLFSALVDRERSAWPAIRLAIVTMAANPGVAVRCLIVEAACVTAVLLVWPLVLIVPAAGAAVLFRLCRTPLTGREELAWIDHPTSLSS